MCSSIRGQPNSAKKELYGYSPTNRPVPVRRGSILGRGQLRIRAQLPLLELPAGNRGGVQAIRRYRSREAQHRPRSGQPAHLRKCARARCALREVRLASVLASERRPLPARDPRHAGRRAVDSADGAHLRRLQGLLVHDYGRAPAAPGIRLTASAFVAQAVGEGAVST